MMKKLLIFFFILVSGVGAICASDTQVDGIWYDFDSATQTATVTYRGNSSEEYADEYSGSVVIPSSVIYNAATYTVTSIRSDAFYRCKSLSAITIPESVTSIEAGSFSECALTSVTINSEAILNNKKFSNIFSLSNIFGSTVTEYIIGNDVKSIGLCAFSSCTSLTTVTIPESVTTIGAQAFQGCSSLASITIPNSVKSIGTSAFYACKSLTSVVIPDSVTTILGGTFWDCTSLKSVTIGKGVTNIENAFAFCYELSYLYCNAITPPAVNKSLIENNAMKYGYLFVPCESKHDYEEHAIWGEFEYIECVASEGIENASSSRIENRGSLVLKNGQVLILRNGKMYTMQGAEVR